MILSKFVVATSCQSLINTSIAASFTLQELQALYLHSLCVAPQCWTISNNKSTKKMQDISALRLAVWGNCRLSSLFTKAASNKQPDH